MALFRIAVLVFALLISAVAVVGPAPSINQSVIALKNEAGEIFCSGFVINQERRLVMTAEHCINQVEQPIMNQKRGWEVYHIPPLDVAILQADAVFNVPALIARKTLPEPDEKISAYGYANGRDSLRRVDGKILFPIFFVSQNGPPMTLFVPDVIQGMSGGPIVDKNGEVVGINLMTRTNPSISITHPMLLIYNMTKEYWGT